MLFAYSPYILPLLGAALISLGVIVYIWPHRRTTGTTALIWLSVAIIAWSVGYALEIAVVGLPGKLIMGKAQYLPIAFVPVIWLVFAHNHFQPEKRWRLPSVLALSIVPLATIGLVFTTEWHRLVWGQYEVFQAGNFSALAILSRGPWFWAYSAYSYILLVWGALIVIRAIFKTRGLYRAQALILIAGVLAPWVGNALYLTGNSPIPYLDLTPFAFTITVVSMAWAAYGFRLADITPIARDIVIEAMSNGMIVLDLSGRISDINPAAGRMIGIPAAQALGRPAQEVFSPWPHLIERFRGVAEAKEIVSVGEGEAKRQYEIQISPLYDRRQNLVGRVITLHDVCGEQVPPLRFAAREPDTTQLAQELEAASGQAAAAPPASLWGKITAFFVPPLKKDIAIPASVNPRWHQMLERAFTSTLRIVALLGSIGLLFTIPFYTTFIPAIIFMCAVAALWWLGLARKVALRFRSNLVLITVYLIAFVETLNYGYSVESFTFFLTFTILAIVLLELRGGVAALIISAITLAIFGWLIGQRMYIPPALSPDVSISPRNVQAAATSLMLFVACALGLMMSIAGLLKSMSEAWSKEIQALNLLQQERDLLEQRVTERTRELVEARDKAVRAGDELRKYFRAIEQSGSTIIITDADGKIEYVNPKFKEQTGYSFAEARGQKPSIVKSGEHSEEFYRELWDTIRSGQVWRGELHNRRKDGTLFWESATIAPVFGDGEQITGYVAIKEDITDMKAAQEALALSRDQALEANRLKGQMLSRVSHELRTPLGAILGFAELLKMRTFGPLNPEQEDAVSQIMDSTNYLTQIVDELLDQAQIESKSMVLSMDFFSPADVLEKMKADMLALAENKGLSLTTEMAVDVPARLYGDERRILQILINLVGNAIKYTEAGNVHVSVYRPSPAHWAFDVTDSGAGIPKEAQDYIFEPFRQVDSSITRDNRGTGLGLSITRQLVELMDGEISLKSEVGKGSTFTVILPILEKGRSHA